MTDALAKVLAETGPILLDFDGPVCSIFAGYPAPVVARELRAVLVGRGVELPDTIRAEPDPLEVLRWTGRTGQVDLTHAVEDVLCAAELRAVATAAPTPYAREVIVAARKAERPVAIISNNSASTISAYLTAHRLAGHIHPIVGRTYGQPERMKPSPSPILAAAAALDVAPASCVVVGDSLTDITAAQAAGARIIGYANKPGKAKSFAEVRADAVTTTMADIAVALVDNVGQ
jgi:HAD superfamily hydrolase (TIGR01509 family)